MARVQLDPSEDLQALLREEKRINGDLKKLEQQIYALETAYLENTSDSGNMVRGWGDLLTVKANPKNMNAHKKPRILEEDRIFSMSSSTAMRVRSESIHYN